MHSAECALPEDPNVNVVTPEALDVSTANTASESDQRLVLKLYVCGASPRADAAVANLRHICDNDLRGDYSLDVIDVLEQPDLAEEAKVLATPTLIKLLPLPLRRIIGDLSDKEKLLVGLEIGRRRARQDSPPNAT
jgi:circadian clock protein KaiB